MTAPVIGFDLVQARRDTPHWPPLDGDIWADRNGREWLAGIQLLPGDHAIIAFRYGNTGCLPSYALEVYGPMRMVSAGHERQRFDRLPADARERHAAYLASVCWLCGPEGATGDYCGTCDEPAVAA
ncbi:hypothetical protein QQG74_09950 [Micromonospora sp. FIMYZ51]|uniref:hypothetical protein n=1 Tax=Micromonospora sp. FIMYZ51 TaxID=3051832 RepID=UPI00311E7BE3